MVQYLNINQL